MMMCVVVQATWREPDEASAHKRRMSTSQMLRAVGLMTVAYARYLRAFLRRYFSCENSVLLAKVLLDASNAARICAHRVVWLTALDAAAL